MANRFLSSIDASKECGKKRKATNPDDSPTASPTASTASLPKTVSILQDEHSPSIMSAAQSTNSASGDSNSIVS